MLLKIKKIKRIINLRSQKNYIHHSVNIDYTTQFEGANEVYSNSTIINTTIGYATYISNNCIFSNTEIGRFCSIADNVKVIAGNHPTQTYISTHPLFYSKHPKGNLKFRVIEDFEEYSFAKNSSRFVVIGNDVWIGSHSLIMNGVTIGNGAIIAAGSVVTKDVLPFSIVGGVPAKVIKYRFNEEEIKLLQNLEWWNKDIEWLKENAHYFNNIKNLEKYDLKEFDFK